MTIGIAILALLIALYAAVADRLGRWSVTMPMVFVLAGFVLGPGVTGLLPISPDSETVKSLTEITLAVLLFADASTLQLSEVRRRRAPARPPACHWPAAYHCLRRGRSPFAAASGRVGVRLPAWHDPGSD